MANAIPLKIISGTSRQLASTDLVHADGIAPRSGTVLSLGGDAATTQVDMNGAAISLINISRVGGNTIIIGNIQLGSGLSEPITVGGSIFTNLAFTKESAHTIYVDQSTTPGAAGGGLTISPASATAISNKNGGNLNLTGGVGGQADAGSAPAGGGSQFVFTSGAGGAANTGTGAAGAGGQFQLLGGNGGGGTATGVAGAGGAIQIQSGNGGADGGAGGANGGALSLDAGNASGAGTNGALTIGATFANSVGIGRTGKVTTLNGDTTVGAAITDTLIITAAIGTDIQLRKELSHQILVQQSTTVNTAGGDFILKGGRATSPGSGGGGSIQAIGGIGGQAAGGTAGGDGGLATVVGGVGGAAAAGAGVGGTGGTLTLSSGVGGAGTATGVAGSGGSVGLVAGSAGANGGAGGANGGGVSIDAGAGTGAGSAGSISIGATNSTITIVNGSSSVQLKSAGTTRLTVSTTAVTSTLPILTPAGVVGAPAVAVGELTTGLWLNTTGILAVSLAGAQKAQFFASGNDAFIQLGAIGTGINYVSALASNTEIALRGSIATTAQPSTSLRNTVAFTGSAAAQVGTLLAAGVNQTGGAGSGFTQLKLKMGLAADGTGTPVFGGDGGFFIDCQTNSTSVFKISSAGTVVLASQKITSMADGSVATDGATFGQVTAVAFPGAITQSSSSLTLDDTYNGKTIYVTFAGTCTITVPQTLTAGFSCSVQNVDAAAVTTWTTSGTQALFSASSFLTNDVRYAFSGITVRSATHTGLSGTNV